MPLVICHTGGLAWQEAGGNWPKKWGEIMFQLVGERASWQDKAACRGPQADLFFPPSYAERKDERTLREGRAKAICSTCVVLGDCLSYAVSIREPHGIWGGKNENERRDLIARSAS